MLRPCRGRAGHSGLDVSMSFCPWSHWVSVVCVLSLPLPLNDIRQLAGGQGAGLKLPSLEPATFGQPEPTTASTQEEQNERNGTLSMRDGHRHPGCAQVTSWDRTSSYSITAFQFTSFTQIQKKMCCASFLTPSPSVLRSPPLFMPLLSAEWPPLFSYVPNALCPSGCDSHAISQNILEQPTVLEVTGHPWEILWRFIFTSLYLFILTSIYSISILTHE